jgi:hypothetical protein
VRRVRTLRWWLLVAAFVLTALVGAGWVVGNHGGRADLLFPIIYGAVPAAVPLALAPLPSAGFRPILVVVILVEAFLALWGGWFLLPALVLHLAALFTRRPASARLVARPLAGAVGVTVALLVITEFAPGVGEDRATEANNAIFDVAEKSDHFDGASGLGNGVAIELDDWTSDEEVARMVARVRAIHDVSRVERGGDSGACGGSE